MAKEQMFDYTRMEEEERKYENRSVEMENNHIPLKHKTFTKEEHTQFVRNLIEANTCLYK